MRINNDWLTISYNDPVFKFELDWLILKESIKCGLGWHSMDWENDDGEIHCYCYKKVINCDLQ